MQLRNGNNNFHSNHSTELAVTTLYNEHLISCSLSRPKQGI